MVATRGPVVRGAEWLGQGESRRKTLPRTSAQSPRQLERVTLSPSFSLLLRPSISPSVSLHPPVPPVSPSSSSYLPSHARFVSSCPPSPSHLSTRTSPSPRRLLFLIPSPSRREIPSSSSPCPPLSRPPLIASFTFSQPLVEQAERADSDFRVLRRPRITSVLRRPINIALSLLPPSFHRLPRSLSLSPFPSFRRVSGDSVWPRHFRIWMTVTREFLYCQQDLGRRHATRGDRVTCSDQGCCLPRRRVSQVIVVADICVLTFF